MRYKYPRLCTTLAAVTLYGICVIVSIVVVASLWTLTDSTRKLESTLEDLRTCVALANRCSDECEELMTSCQRTMDMLEHCQKTRHAAEWDALETDDG